MSVQRGWSELQRLQHSVSARLGLARYTPLSVWDGSIANNSDERSSDHCENPQSSSQDSQFYEKGSDKSTDDDSESGSTWTGVYGPHQSPFLAKRLTFRNRRCLFVTVAVLLCVCLAALSLKTGRHKDFEANNNTQGGFTTNEAAAEQMSFGSGVLEAPCCSQTSTSIPKDQVLPITAQSDIVGDILEKWIANGQVVSSLDISRHVRIDGMTLWVNGSDARHCAQHKFFAKNPFAHDDPTQYSSLLSECMAPTKLSEGSNRFRQMDELRYSLRSARQSLAKFLGTHHVIAPGTWQSLNFGEERNGTWDRLYGDRAGQVPQWLDYNSSLVAFGNQSAQGTPALRLHNDWETFVAFDTNVKDMEEWKKNRLPTFSSIAAESVVGASVPGLSEIFFLSSDDMFFGGTLSIADFYTPLLGPVMHLDINRILVEGMDPILGSEMTSLYYSAGLMAKRFGQRGFPYPTHMQKAHVQPLTIEARSMWREQFDAANSQRFRGDCKQANSHTLGYGLIMERHREALLWSFLVARIDTNGDGILSSQELVGALRLMGANADDKASVSVFLPHRESSSPEQVQNSLKAAKYPLPARTSYRFSSFDGYPLSAPEHAFTEATGLRRENGPMRFLEGEHLSPQDLKRFDIPFCHLELSSCLPRDKNGLLKLSTTDIFKRFAFEEPKCGDCLIMHLLGHSGKRGLSAFLPEADMKFPVPEDLEQQTPQPFHLPLNDNWRHANFSLSNVASENGLGYSSVTRRTFAMSLLARYSYVIGNDDGFRFEQLIEPQVTNPMLDRLSHELERNQVAFVCINDDISSGVEELTDRFHSFASAVWPASQASLPFERDLNPS